MLQCVWVRQKDEISASKISAHNKLKTFVKTKNFGSQLNCKKVLIIKCVKGWLSHLTVTCPLTVHFGHGALLGRNRCVVESRKSKRLYFEERHPIGAEGNHPRLLGMKEPFLFIWPNHLIASLTRMLRIMFTVIEDIDVGVRHRKTCLEEVW